MRSSGSIARHRMQDSSNATERPDLVSAAEQLILPEAGGIEAISPDLRYPAGIVQAGILNHDYLSL